MRSLEKSDSGTGSRWRAQGWGRGRGVSVSEGRVSDEDSPGDEVVMAASTTALSITELYT